MHPPRSISEPSGEVQHGPLRAFLELGVDHILTGYDHLLFLLALLVVAPTLRALAWTITAFTAAHSITLALAALEVVTLPGRFVEIAIALSIAYVAAENLLRLEKRSLWLEALVFGLLHGLGFAGFLGEALRGEDDLVVPLIGFNLGVELGQLLFVVPLALLLRGLTLALRSRSEEEGPPPRLVPERLGLAPDTLLNGFLEGTRVGATPVAHGTALPHMRLPGIDHPELVLVRCAGGVSVDEPEAFFAEDGVHASVQAIFFLVSPEDDPGQHLRILAQLASRIDEEDFVARWLSVRDPENLRSLFLDGQGLMHVLVRPGERGAEFLGKKLRELGLPEGTLVVAVRRGKRTIVPRGETELVEGDRLTIIGESEALQELQAGAGE